MVIGAAAEHSAVTWAGTLRGIEAIVAWVRIGPNPVLHPLVDVPCQVRLSPFAIAFGGFGTYVVRRTGPGQDAKVRATSGPDVIRVTAVDRYVARRV